MPESAMGSLLYTLLDGAALRAFDAVSKDAWTGVIKSSATPWVGGFLKRPRMTVWGGRCWMVSLTSSMEQGESTAAYTRKARSAVLAAETEGAKFLTLHMDICSCDLPDFPLTKGQSCWQPRDKAMQKLMSLQPCELRSQRDSMLANWRAWSGGRRDLLP